VVAAEGGAQSVVAGGLVNAAEGGGHLRAQGRQALPEKILVAEDQQQHRRQQTDGQSHGPQRSATEALLDHQTEEKQRATNVAQQIESREGVAHQLSGQLPAGQHRKGSRRDHEAQENHAPQPETEGERFYYASGSQHFYI